MLPLDINSAKTLCFLKLNCNTIKPLADLEGRRGLSGKKYEKFMPSIFLWRSFRCFRNTSGSVCVWVWVWTTKQLPNYHLAVWLSFPNLTNGNSVTVRFWLFRLKLKRKRNLRHAECTFLGAMRMYSLGPLFTDIPSDEVTFRVDTKARETSLTDGFIDNVHADNDKKVHFLGVNELLGMMQGFFWGPTIRDDNFPEIRWS